MADTTTTTSPGMFNVNEMFNKLFTSVSSNATSLKTKLESVNGQQLDQGTLLSLQYEVGTYNTMLELTSNMTKSVIDEAKNIAQRTS